MITLGHYLKPYSKRIALGTVIKIVGTITELFLPWILSYMIDEVAPEKNVARIFCGEPLCLPARWLRFWET